MRKKFAPVVVLATAALALTGAAAGGTHATKLNFAATLNAGQEVPHPVGTKVGAAGKFTATVTGTKIAWKLTFSHLTGPANAAHIHAGKKGVPGNVIVPLCGPCSTGLNSVCSLARLNEARPRSPMTACLPTSCRTARRPRRCSRESGACWTSRRGISPA